MFLRPTEKKYKKEFKGKNLGISNNLLKFGSFGICSLDYGYLTSRHIETGRRLISKKVKVSGKFWICIFPSKPITRKPNEVRMGKGKGSVSFWVGLVKPGQILYEMEGINKSIADKIFKSMCFKFPIRLILINKFDNLKY